MSNFVLKPGWRMLRFEQLARSINDRVDDPKTAGVEYYVGLEHLDADSLKVRRWGSPDDVEATKLRFQKGDIIFGRRRAYQRKLGVADFDGICSAHALVLRAKPENVLPEFLPFFMQSDIFMERAQAISVGSLSPTINWKTLAKEEFALPPLGAQKQISSLLIALEECNETYRMLVKSANDFRLSLQKKFFIEVPEGDKVKLGDVSDVQNGTTPSRSQAKYWGGAIPWLPTGKVNERLITAADEYITEIALKECPLKLIPSGSTLIAMIGQGQTRGRAAYLEVEACINQNFAAITPRETVDPSFLFYQLESMYESLRYGSQGSNQYALNCKLIRNFPIYVPSLDRQKVIAQSLKAADDVLVHTEAREQRARSTKVSFQNTILGNSKVSGPHV